MAGFEVIYGLDSNQDAINTFSGNFPSARIEKRKIEMLETLDIPDADVIVGGPPCVNFSTSKGSRANILEGIKLVQAFLRIIHIKKPKYWIMENVPRIGLHLPNQIPLRWIGIEEDGFLDVPTKHEFDMSRYGIPQRRKRLLIGNYPIPKPTHIDTHGLELFKQNLDSNSVRTLRDVVCSLPLPEEGPKGEIVTDLNYGFTISDYELTDHFMDTRIDPIELKRIANAKTEHPYMGKMDFPDNLERPARTVVGLQMGRETLVIQDSIKNYRRATIRECAIIQTFPINFQFSGTTIGSRYKQVGNAVPPLLTNVIANEVLRSCGLPDNQCRFVGPPPFPKCIKTKEKKRVVDYSRPRVIHFPGKEVRGTRLEIVSELGKSISWKLLLHIGEGKGNRQVIDVSTKELQRFVTRQLNIVSAEYGNKISKVKKDVDSIICPKAEVIHKQLHDTYGEMPDFISKAISVLDTYFERSKFSEINIDLADHRDYFGKNFMRVRMLVSILIAQTLVKKLNQR